MIPFREMDRMISAGSKGARLAKRGTTPELRKTLAVGMYGMVAEQRNSNFGMFCAGSLITAIPTVVVFHFLQRFIVSGLTMGAVKG